MQMTEKMIIRLNVMKLILFILIMNAFKMIAFDDNYNSHPKNVIIS